MACKSWSRDIAPGSKRSSMPLRSATNAAPRASSEQDHWREARAFGVGSDIVPSCQGELQLGHQNPEKLASKRALWQLGLS